MANREPDIENLKKKPQNRGVSTAREAALELLHKLFQNPEEGTPLPVMLARATKAAGLGQRDAALLSEHPELFAQGIYDGIVDYFDPFYVLNMNVLIVMICLLSIILIIAGFLIIRKYMSKQSETGRMEDEKENLFENGAEPFR